MINFYIVDFNERRLEEVISFFWRSVYNGGNYPRLLWLSEHFQFDYLWLHLNLYISNHQKFCVDANTVTCPCYWTGKIHVFIMFHIYLCCPGNRVLQQGAPSSQQQARAACAVGFHHLGAVLDPLQHGLHPPGSSSHLKHFSCSGTQY